MDTENNRQQTPAERLAHIDGILDQYEASLGISGDLYVDSDLAKKYINLPMDLMAKLSIDQCAEAALMLSCLSFFLQKNLNKEKSRVTWADNEIKRVISGKENQYKGSWESQFNQAIKNDGYASKVSAIKRYAEQRVDRLTYLSSSVVRISDSYKNLQSAKVRRNG